MVPVVQPLWKTPFVVSAGRVALLGGEGGESDILCSSSLPQNQVSLYCVHADVSKGNFCGCFWSDAFQNTLLERNQY